MPTAKKYPLYKYILAAIDFSTVAVSHVLAFIFAELWLNEHLPSRHGLLIGEVAYVIGVAATCVFIFYSLGLYQINVFVTVVAHLERIIKGLVVLLAGIAAFSIFTAAEYIIDSWQLILSFAITEIVLFAVIRVVLFRQVYLSLSRNRVLQRNVLIVGAGEHGRNVAVNLFMHNYVGLRVVGFLDDSVCVGTPIFNSAKVVGRTNDMADCVRRYDVKEILICLEHIEHTVLMELMEQTMPLNVIVKVSSPLYEIVPLRRAIEHYGSVPVLGVFQLNLTGGKEIFKRAFDIVVGLITLLLLMPMFAAVALLIKMDSRGPVFFRQVRVGKNGKHFKINKFRSMTLGADSDEERKKQMSEFIKTKRKELPSENISTKIVDESRVTSVGKWLRKLSIDEFPQLFNVLRGEMSLVGPRPCLPYEWDHYEEWHKHRLSVLPGLTGIWQVAGRSVVGFDDMVVLDLHYIQNASLLLDVSVMLKTIPVVLTGTGAK